jgi:hypothetical protein
MNIFQRWKQTTIANKALVVTGALMAFGTLFYASAAIIQVCIMKRSAEATSEQIDKLIKAADIQASAAGKIAAASTRNANAAETFSEAAKRLARASEVANGQNLRLFSQGNRPWLFVRPAEPKSAEKTMAIERGAVLAIPLDVTDIGKSPAIQVTDVVAFAKVFSNTSDEHRFLSKTVFTIPIEDPRNGVIVPDTPMRLEVNLDHPLTDIEANGLLKTPPTVHLLTCGRVEYGSPITPTKVGQMYTEFCWLFYGGLSPGRAQWLQAKYHGEMK